MKSILVAGGGGLIGGHLVKNLLHDGYRVRAVSRSPLDQWKQVHPNAENISLDLSMLENCRRATEGIDIVYNLAAEIGGVQFIEKEKAKTMLSVLINTHLLMAAHERGVQSYFYASSDAVTAAEVPQNGTSLTDVIEDGHIWEKLFSEKVCSYFREDFNLRTRIGRLHNVYGPFDIYNGGRERAPAALCRKAAEAKATRDDTLEIWGDGTQIRSFLFVTDAIAGIRKTVESDHCNPVRIGTNERLTINQLVDAVEAAAGMQFQRKYILTAPVGITRSYREINENQIPDWTPRVSLNEGIKELYNWIEEDMKNRGLIQRSL